MLMIRVFLLTAVLITGSLSNEIFAQEKEEPFFHYNRFDSTSFKKHYKFSTYIYAEDSVKLAIDVFIPGEAPISGTFPVVLQYTPYNRAHFIPKMGVGKHLVSSMTGNGWGPIYDLANFPHSKTLLEHGYALVAADMRGTGASFGSNLPLMPQIGRDGKTIVDWIAEQSWCDGNVGMMGPSYLGWAQYMTAANHPKALKCIMPEVMAFEMYTGASRPGGIAAQKWVKNFSQRLTGFNQNQYELDKFILPAVPVIDEDGDGKLVDERPKEMDSLVLKAEIAPKYADNAERTEKYYLRATQEHIGNIPVDFFLNEESKFIDASAPAPYENISYHHVSVGYYVPEVAQSGVAIYHLGGWFDGFVRGTTKLYASLAESNVSKMMISPRVHFPSIPKAYQKAFDYKEKFLDQYSVEQLRFFDYHLKGINNSVKDELPVKIYVMNEGWRSESEWPIARTQYTNFYLNDSGSLTMDASVEGKDSYAVDFSHGSGYGKKQLNRWLMYTSGPKEIMDRTLTDQKCLVYETEPLKQDTEVTGHPIIDLHLSSTQDYGDVFVYLCDVDQNGNSQYITEGQLRAGWFEEQTPEDQIHGKAQILPELPWHGYKSTQWKDKALANGEIIPMRFDLIPTSWKFKAGHRIRIAIAGADIATFELNPNLCPDGKCPETEMQIHRGSTYPSKIVLPIVPPKQLSTISVK